MPANSDHIANKRKLDEAVLKELKTNRIGDQAENGDQSQTDFHFIVSKDYDEGIHVILSVVKTYNMEQQVLSYWY